MASTRASFQTLTKEPQALERFKQRAYLVAVLIGIPTIFTAWWVEHLKEAPNEVILFLFPAHGVFTLWLAWALSFGKMPLRLLERMVFIEASLVYLLTYGGNLWLSPSLGTVRVQFAEGDVWFLLALCVLAFIIFDLRTGLLWALSLCGLTSALLIARFLAIPEDTEALLAIFRIQIACGAVLAVIYIFGLFRTAFLSSQAESRALQLLAYQDPLTGLHNRRYFDEQLKLLLASSKRHRHPLTVALCDIDSFKQINDNLSHAVGDDTLRTLASILKENLRDGDLVARYGGEEFVMAFSEISLTEAAQACEKLRQAVERYPWDLVHPDLRVTLSVGLSNTLKMQTPEQLLDAADTKLYEAKRAGRNQVCR